MGIPIKAVTDKMMSMMSPEQRGIVEECVKEAKKVPRREGLVFLSHEDMCEWYDERCKERGFLLIFSRSDRPTTTQVGVLDRLVIYQGKLIALDFKFGKDKPSSRQLTFQNRCREAGVPAEFFWSAYKAWAWTLEQFGITE